MSKKFSNEISNIEILCTKWKKMLKKEQLNHLMEHNITNKEYNGVDKMNVNKQLKEIE